MADEMKLIADVGRARRAQEILDNELFNEAIANIERDLISAWKATPARDTDGRERCWTAIQQLGNLKGYFQSALSDGQLAKADLKNLTERPKRFGVI